ncbi:proteophosphoglycan ppg4 [Angomonas deanei]|uniref:Uncharacterized protein n=1 Tax=Angomonas deanei TaxID=59799 RepID=A0A7G2CD94_9TRYP|nr:proteophosphoglycan ppg4 [Angomonas deanei]CAD2217489.1 hypothetical protein, conserved [Angomonas deanei]|eukprot:EPY19895.1 proteophosphoglycan ppg4 [Angomonas deanei]
MNRILGKKTQREYPKNDVVVVLSSEERGTVRPAKKPKQGSKQNSGGVVTSRLPEASNNTVETSFRLGNTTDLRGTSFSLSQPLLSAGSPLGLPEALIVGPDSDTIAPNSGSRGKSQSEFRGERSFTPPNGRSLGDNGASVSSRPHKRETSISFKPTVSDYDDSEDSTAKTLSNAKAVLRKHAGQPNMNSSLSRSGRGASTFRSSSTGVDRRHRSPGASTFDEERRGLNASRLHSTQFDVDSQHSRTPSDFGRRNSPAPIIEILDTGHSRGKNPISDRAPPASNRSSKQVGFSKENESVNSMFRPSGERADSPSRTAPFRSVSTGAPNSAAHHDFTNQDDDYDDDDNDDESDEDLEENLRRKNMDKLLEHLTMSKPQQSTGESPRLPEKLGGSGELPNVVSSWTGVGGSGWSGADKSEDTNESPTTGTSGGWTGIGGFGVVGSTNESAGDWYSRMRRLAAEEEETTKEGEKSKSGSLPSAANAPPAVQGGGVSPHLTPPGTSLSTPAPPTISGKMDPTRTRRPEPPRRTRQPPHIMAFPEDSQRTTKSAETALHPLPKVAAGSSPTVNMESRPSWYSRPYLQNRRRSSVSAISSNKSKPLSRKNSALSSELPNLSSETGDTFKTTGDEAVVDNTKNRKSSKISPIIASSVRMPVGKTRHSPRKSKEESRGELTSSKPEGGKASPSKIQKSAGMGISAQS